MGSEILIEGSFSLGCVVLGKVRSAVGSAQLLMSQKFQQFRGLCEQNLVSHIPAHICTPLPPYPGIVFGVAQWVASSPDGKNVLRRHIRKKNELYFEFEEQKLTFM